MPDISKLSDTVEINAALCKWMAIHGALCLALRHPEMGASVREVLLECVAKLEALFLGTGLLTPEEIAEIHRVEVEARRT